MLNNASHVRVAIIGGGFAGLGTSIALQRAGVEHVVLEKADDLGGTWRDNHYPGCKCDVPSHLYSFSFALNPDWSHTYSAQPEIWAYLRRTAERFGVRDRFRFGAEVCQACWDEAAQRWEVETAAGRWTADVLVSATGGLSVPATPDIPGLAGFQGSLFHSARWEDGHDFAGERVAVIGTGASAVQLVPRIQPRVGRLLVFQRTPAWVLPHGDRPIRDWERALYRRVPFLQRIVRGGVYWTRELLVFGLCKDPRWMEPVRRIATRHLERQVADPELRARLMPSFSPGCKRLLPSNDFYPALAADNVDVITEPIREVGERAIVTADGTEHEVDTIVLATGFRVTDNPTFALLRGRGGRTLAEAWREDGMQAYKGATVAGFPNLFLVTGPNTGIGHTSLVVMIEAQVRYVMDALRTMDRRGVAEVEVRPDAQREFNDDVHRRMQRTVWNAGGCASWYLDARGRNTTLWPDFTWRFGRLTRRFDAGAYELRSRAAG